MKVALAGDVALELMASYFTAAGHTVYVPAGFATWRQELLDPESGLNKFCPDIVFDVTAHDDVLAAEVPGFFDERMRRLASMPYSLDGIHAIVEELDWEIVRHQKGGAKKVLAVDADNTLWNGIISEDGKDAVSPCIEFQQGLLQLRADGVLLVLASKNDPVFPFMRDDMPLADSHFAALKVNWRPKAGNLIEACKELNLGVDSVVFLDDNPFERAQMESHLPQVTVAPWKGWDKDNSARQLLRRLREYFFNGAGTTAEDHLRAADYEANAARAKEMAGASSLDDYLRSLELRVMTSLAEEGDLDRLAQMAGKTNQFNATTIRRTRDEFAALIKDKGKRVFVFRTSDRFGEQGIVCYIIVDLASRRITDFVMSCRAMGRTLENFAYAYICETLGITPQIDYSPTAKNAPFKAFLATGPSTSHMYSTAP